jgi:hypothetical protein
MSGVRRQYLLCSSRYWAVSAFSIAHVFCLADQHLSRQNSRLTKRSVGPGLQASNVRMSCLSVLLVMPWLSRCSLNISVYTSVNNRVIGIRDSPTTVSFAYERKILDIHQPDSKELWRCLKKKTPWSESASERYRPSDSRLSAKWLPTCADRRCHVVSVTDPSGRSSRFSRRSRYFSIK